MDWSTLFVRFIRNTLNASYTVCTTWLRLFLHEPNKYCDKSLKYNLFSIYIISNVIILGMDV